MEPAAARVRFHRRNTLLLGAVEVGWGPAMAFLDPSSILPVLLRQLGADYTALAILPVITYGGSFPFELISPFATERLPRKRLLVWAIHCAIPLIWLALGLWLAGGDPRPGAASIATFSLGYLASVGLTGFLIPLWYDYMGKITDPLRRGSAFSLIFALQSIAGFGGALLAQRVLEARGLTSEASAAALAPSRFAVCYFLAAATAMLGNQAFLWTVEDTPAGETPPRPRVADYFRTFLGYLTRDPTLRRYIAVRAVTRLAPIVATYASVQAVARFGERTPVALVTGALIAGKLSTSLLSWRFADTVGMKPFLVGGTASLAAAGSILALVETFPQPALGLGPYFAVAFLTGVFLITDGSANATFVMNLAPDDKRATYLTTVNGALFPLTASVPILAARVADRLGLVPVQAVASGAFLVAALVLVAFVHERRPSVPAPST